MRRAEAREAVYRSRLFPGDAAKREGGGGLWHRAGAAATALTTLGLLAGVPAARACAACFGAEETSMVEGTRLGVWFLLGITVAVQGGFVGFFIYLRRRAKRIAALELESEWSELQRATR